MRRGKGRSGKSVVQPLPRVTWDLEGLRAFIPRIGNCLRGESTMSGVSSLGVVFPEVNL